MKYRWLGTTGVKVSQLCFGTMSFGGDADRQTSAAMFSACLDAGINFFDCANVYNGGQAEEILGSLIANHRRELVITSKVYFPFWNDVNGRGASRRHILESVQASLNRMKTDYLDILFIHHFDDYTRIEDTVRTLDDLVRQGKILYAGASNFAAWQIMKALGVARKEMLNEFRCIQPMYNLVKRQAEVELLPMAQAEALGVISYSPLAGGLLSGKYGKKKRPDAGRLIDNSMYQVRYGDTDYYAIADEFADLAQELGYNPVSLAVAWAGSHPGITAPIIGARNVTQLKDSLASADIDITADLRQRITTLSPEPAPATDRNDEATASNYAAQLKK